MTLKKKFVPGWSIHNSFRIFGFASLILLQSACSKFSATQKIDTGATVSAAGSQKEVSDISAFQNSVYKITSTNCVGCHGAAVAPLHGAPDLGQAYQSVLPFVNFDNPSASRLAVQAGNGHCGIAVCNGKSDSIVSAILEWRELRLPWAVQPTLLNYVQGPLAGALGMPITDSLNFTGNPTYFSVSPALPEGLSINPATGTITGTPTIFFPASSFTVKASNSAGSSSVTLSIQVKDYPPTNLTYAQNPLILTKGVVLVGALAATSGGTVESFSVSPALPAGLTLDSVSGKIFGTPTALSMNTSYTVTATNSGGSASVVLKIEVNDVAPQALMYATNPLVATKELATTPDLPANTGGVITTYSVNPALPTGLALDPKTGVVSGAAQAVSGITAYTITGMNSGGSTTVILNIQVNDVAPSGLAYGKNPLIATKGVLITPDVATYTGGPAILFSSNPALPTGLKLDNLTGAISGTPTNISAAANYLITVSNSGGSSSVSLNIQVNDVPPSNLVYAKMTLVATKGVAITANTPTSSGGAVTNYSVNPPLPAGLVIDAVSGVISGIPTVSSAQASYAVTAKNSGGPTTTVLQMTVIDPPPSNLTYAKNPLIVTKGILIQPDLVTLGTGTATSFSINPGLPSGLSFDSATGTVSGTPSVISPLSAYVVSATTAGGSASVTLNIQVLDVIPSNLAYLRNPLVGIKGSAIAPDTASTNGGAIVSFGISPNLPAGFTLDSKSGTITGTPTAISAQTLYIVTATNSAGSATVSLSVRVDDVAPTGLAYPITALVLIKGAAFSPNVPTNSGGAITSYSINPQLPAGLILNAATGAISGVASAASPLTSYTVSGANVTGSATANLTIQVNDIPPTNLLYSTNPMNATLGMPITSTPSSMGGAPTLYTVTPSLPAGLSLNAQTGVVSGTPTALSARANYTIKASNSGGSASSTVTITVNDVAPIALSYTQPSAKYLVGLVIAANTPSGSGGAIVSYSVAPALPTGLVLNALTGVISGTPSTASVYTPYVVTAKNSGGSTTTTVNIMVIVPNPNNPNANWTYINANVLPACISCHNSMAPSNVIDFSTYQGVLKAVVKTQPLNSIFYTYAAPGSVEPMPLGGTPLSQTQLSGIFDWIYVGAPGPSPTPTPPPSTSPTPDPSATNGSVAGYGSVLIPTTYAIIGRIQAVLGPAGVDQSVGSFNAAIKQVKGSLPNTSNPMIATGYDKVPLLIYAACSDAKPTFYGVDTAKTVTLNLNALVAAGVAMVNAHTGNLAATGTALNTQVTLVLTKLVNDDNAVAANSKMTFVSVCMAANTFGVMMTGY